MWWRWLHFSVIKISLKSSCILWRTYDHRMRIEWIRHQVIKNIVSSCVKYCYCIISYWATWLSQEKARQQLMNWCTEYLMHVWCFQYIFNSSDVISLFLIVSFSFIHSVLWHCWLGDRKGIRPVKKELGVGLLVVMIWLELCTTYSFSSPVVTTTSIILCFNKHQLTQVHLENGR